MSEREKISKEFIGELLQAEARIFGYIRSQVPNRADADDLLQETVSQLWSKFDSFRPGSNFLAWAREVARHEIQHYYRRQARDRRIFSAEFIALIDRRLPEMEGELLQMREAFRNCMAKLRASDRDIVERCYESGTTVAQVAEQVHRPLETIKSILKRSRRALYECVRRTMLTENRESEDRK